MNATVLSAGVLGVTGYGIRVHALSTPGGGTLEIRGMPDAAAREARIRVDRALESAGYPLPPRAAENPSIRLGGTRYILVEFPRLVTAETVETALAHVVKLGLRPLLAHPERYSSCSTGAAQRWKAAGAVAEALGVDRSHLGAVRVPPVELGRDERGDVHAVDPDIHQFAVDLDVP